MTVQITKEGWLPLFTQRRAPNGFLQRMFTAKANSTYSGKKVAIDIRRFGEQIAVAVEHGAGPRLNDLDVFTTKEFEPPAFYEAVPFDVLMLLDRMAGDDPYSAAYKSDAAQLVSYMIDGFSLMSDKIARTIELQAAQILQTGTVTLINSDGDTMYTINFFPKASHFPTVGVSWTAGGGDPLGDLESLARQIRADGKIQPNRLIMGSAALSNFLQNAQVKEALDSRRGVLGDMNPRFDNSGATFYGNVWVGAYKFEIWTYPETYEHPQTSAVTDFVGVDNVIMLSDGARLDRASARVPLPLGPDPRVSGLLPGRLNAGGENGFDLTPNVYATPNGKQIMAELETRTLLIPVDIDSFGTIDTTT
jgi:hypothetical protein